jgi:hypothetical protein
MPDAETSKGASAGHTATTLAVRIGHSVHAPHVLSKTRHESADLPDLGATTSTRGWVALGAVIILLLAGLIYGLFGSYQNQTMYGGIAIGAGQKFVISASADGVITSLSLTNVVNDAGTPLAQIQPASSVEGGAAPDANSSNATDVALPNQASIASWNVGLGSPVKVGDVLGDAIIFASKSDLARQGAKQPLVAVSFLSLNDTMSLRSALQLEAVALGKDGKAVSAQVDIVEVSNFPVTEAHIALLTGNPTFAHQVITATNGGAYEVDFGYKNPQDYQEIMSSVKSGSRPPVVTGSLATIIATTISTNPLAFLFGGGS